MLAEIRCLQNREHRELPSRMMLHRGGNKGPFIFQLAPPAEQGDVGGDVSIH